MMTKIKDLHTKWMNNPNYAAEYSEMAAEFQLASAIIEARRRAGLTQAELAQRMQTKQPVIARLEAGTNTPSYNTLRRIAEATGSQLRISFEPVAQQ